MKAALLPLGVVETKESLIAFIFGTPTLFFGPTLTGVEFLCPKALPFEADDRLMFLCCICFL